MSDQDEGPSLELPSLSFRRRKKPEAEEAAPEPETVEVAEPLTDSTPEPVADTTADEPTVVVPPSEDAVLEAPVEPVEPVEQPTEVLAPSAPASEPVVPTARARRQRPERTGPRTRWLGASMIGLLSGFAIVGLINATLRACDAARGTSSCGGPGLFVLLIIMALITVGATRLLKWWGFTDAGTVAFLGIALTAIVALVFLTAHLLSLSMVLVIPLITGLAFVIADWVSATMTEADQS